ncbi:hypothetical protein [Catellatospora tritici]|uniref:hypothetical protein n=1 Tax=Catellatospora tritici TaxID=2851566 RepID=UPI001C2CCFB3|nr:hypothetical protein [Catellatospora tritici]MBV1853946.1 hypothetical protein [Catellatospora tritici]
MKALEANFSALLAHLTRTLRVTRGREEDARRDNRLQRTVDNFLADYQTGVTRDRAMQLIGDIDATLDDSNATDDVRQAVAKLRRDFRLETEPTSPVPEYELFRERLTAVKYQQRISDQGTAAVQ